MPETSVRSIIEGMNPDPFYMPALYFSFDESSAFEGMRTRLEAFIDVMNGNRENNSKFRDRYEEPQLLSEIFDTRHKSLRLKNIVHRLIDPIRMRKFVDTFRSIPKDVLNAYYLKPGKRKIEQITKKSIKNKDKNQKPGKTEKYKQSIEAGV
jgi:hypothetical protein